MLTYVNVAFKFIGDFMKIGNKTNTRKIMEKYNIKTKKQFGQNFLTDENTLNSIVTKANVNDSDTILEIGCGVGALTQLLCENAKEVYAFEIDLTLKDYLRENLTYDNLTIFFKDFLKVDLTTVLPDTEYKVVANLPYYITTPILFKILDTPLAFNELYVMMQKEVGSRLKALPGSKEYNALSIMLQIEYDISELITVSRNVFVPPPNVDSVVMKFVKHDKYDICDKEFFSKFVHDCFKFKRKNLRNNLKGYDLEVITELLASHDFTLQTRAEQVSIEAFVDIVNKYCERVR